MMTRQINRRGRRSSRTVSKFAKTKPLTTGLANRRRLLVVGVPILLLSVLPMSSTQALPGDLDSSFNPCRPGQSTPCGGKVTTGFGSSPERYPSASQAVVVQPDGKIVAAGYANRGYGFFALARHNADGTLDQGFGEGGKTTAGPARFGGLLDLLGSGGGSASDLAIQPDAKIIAVGSDFAVARYNPDGSLDADFGTGGANVSSSGTAYGVALQPDGKIVVVGDEEGGSALARYDLDGSLDETFALGRGRTTVGRGDFRDVAVQSDGKIVIVGTESGNLATRGGFLVARYNADGTPDLSFGTVGRVITSIGRWSGAEAVALQADGKIVAGGVASSSRVEFALARYNSDGTLDEDFGTGGTRTTPFGSGEASAWDIALQSDGKIVAVGEVVVAWPWKSHFAAVRYDTSGGLDTSFGVGGTVTTEFPNAYSTASAVGLQADGKIVAAGFTHSLPPTEQYHDRDFALARYNSDGKLDEGFGTRGRVVTAFRSVTSSMANDLALQPDGKIVAAGDADGENGRVFGLTRYHPDGRLDESFGSGGKVTTPIARPEDHPLALAVALQPDGKIIVAGALCGGYGCDGFALARYNPDGSLDTTFGTGGTLSHRTPGTGGKGAATSVAIQPDGKIVAAGGAGGMNDGDFAVVRYNANGAFDPSFGAGGTVVTSFGVKDPSGFNPLNVSLATGVAIQPDGKILAGGYHIAAITAFGYGPSEIDFAVARYNSDGSLDASNFNPCPAPSAVCGGKATTSISAFDMAQGVAVQSDGGIVLAGKSGVGHLDGSFSLARFTAGGRVDTSFGAAGKVVTQVGPSSRATDVAVQPDNKLVAAGSVSYSADGGVSDSDFALARYNPDGTLDGCFAGDGTVITPIQNIDDASAVAIQPDGQILAAGYSQVNGAGSEQFALTRYDGGPRCGISAIDAPPVTEPPAGQTATATFKVTREGNPALPGVVDFRTKENGSATAGADYTATQGQLVFAPDEVSKDVPVQVLADAAVEDPETFLLELFNPVGAALVRPIATATIVDRPGQPGPQPPVAPVARISDVTVAEPFTKTAPATLTLTLSKPAEAPTSFAYQTADQSAKADLDYVPAKGVVHFSKGQSSATVTVDIKGDALAEPTESFNLALSDPKGATLGDQTAKITILDAGPGLSIGDTTVTEGNSGVTPAVFTVTSNSDPQTRVSVSYAIRPGSATDPGDYQGATATLEFAPGEVAKQITVNITADTELEPDEDYSVALFDAKGAALLRPTGQGTIKNDDTLAPKAALAPIGAAAAFAPQLPPGQTIPVTSTQAQTQSQSQAQQQASQQAQAQQHLQAQVQVQGGVMMEKEKEMQVERAGLGANDAPGPQTYSATARRQPLVPTPARLAIWLGAIAAFCVSAAKRPSPAAQRETLTTRTRQRRFR